MTAGALIGDLLDTYRAYTDLLEAVGHSVNPAAVAGHLAGDEEGREAVEALLYAAESGDASTESAPEDAAEKMEDLLRKLADEVSQTLGDGADLCDPQALLEVLREREDGDRDRVGDAILLNGHRQFLQPCYVPVDEFRRALATRDDAGELALVKLVPFVRRELDRRGMHLADERIRSWFQGEPAEPQVPACLKQIIAGVNGEFKTGLIALEEMTGEEDPDEWLENARQMLKFRSHSAMHKAIAQATSLKYDCVHKALSGRHKAQRVQAEIKYCLEMWLEDLREGLDPEVDENLRGVPVEEMHALLPELDRKFRTKEDLYRIIGERTGVKTGSVRRYFQSNGQLKYAPLNVYRCAEALASDEAVPSSQASYLVDARTRRMAERLADRVNEALWAWRNDAGDEDLQYTYKELRRALIIAIKERRRTIPASA